MKSRLVTSIAFFVLASLLLAGNALAERKQDKRDFFGGPPSAEEKLVHMNEALDLSDEQAVDMLRVLQDKEEKREALRAQTEALMGPEICALMNETEEDILAILTPEQAEQFLQMREDRRARAEAKGRGGRRKGPIDCSLYETSGG